MICEEIQLKYFNPEALVDPSVRVWSAFGLMVRLGFASTRGIGCRCMHHISQQQAVNIYLVLDFRNGSDVYMRAYAAIVIASAL